MLRRQLLLASLALPALLLARAVKPSSPDFDAFVSRERTRGSNLPRYRSIGDALAAAPGQSDIPFRIHIGRGIWNEKLVIDKPNIHLIGEGRGRSILRFDTAAGDRAPNGEPWGTWGCATLRVRAPGFAAREIDIVNGFDYLGHLRHPQLETIGSNGAQAVSLMLDEGSDHVLIERCGIHGHQDTLFTDAGRSVFRDCRISGSVDFIFGGGQSLFDRCELTSRFRPGKQRQGYIAAPSTSRWQSFGLVFRRCRLNCEKEVPAQSVALGRAWRPTRDFADGRYGDPDAIGAAAFIECEMDRHIAREGWDAMKYTARDGARVELQPSAARLCEYANHGPGAQLHSDRPQMSAQQAQVLLSANLLD